MASSAGTWCERSCNRIIGCGRVPACHRSAGGVGTGLWKRRHSGWCHSSWTARSWCAPPSRISLMPSCTSPRWRTLRMRRPAPTTPGGSMRSGTAGLLAAVARARDSGGSDPLVIVVSSAEVYGEGESRPRIESDAARPQGAVQREQAWGGGRSGSGDFGLGAAGDRRPSVSGDRPGQTNRCSAELARGASCRETRRGRGTTSSCGTTWMYGTCCGLRGASRERPSRRDLQLGCGARGDASVSSSPLWLELLRVEAEPVSPTRPRQEPVYLVGDSAKLRRDTVGAND